MIFLLTEKKNLVYINEVQLNDLKKQDANLETIIPSNLINFYRKYYTNINPQDFISIIEYDPLYDENKVSHAGIWLLDKFEQGIINKKNIVLASRMLEIFDRNIEKVKTPHLTKVKDLNALYDIIRPFTTHDLLNIENSETDVVYEDNRWKIIVPQDNQGFLYYLTSYKFFDKFDKELLDLFKEYKDDGKFYINIDKKNNNTKYLFQFENDIFKTINNLDINHPINETLNMSMNVINFYKKEHPIDSIKLFVEHVGDFIDGYALVKVGEEYNFIDEQHNYLTHDWFQYAEPFNDGYALVYNGIGYNFIDNHGHYLSNSWYNQAKSFSHGYASIQIKDRWNFIDNHKKILSSEWFEYAGNFKNNFALIKKDDKWNYINENGEILSDTPFDYADDFMKNGFAIVGIQGKYNFINSNGKIISHLWFDNITEFNDENKATVTLNSKQYEIDTLGHLNKKGELI